MARYSNRWLNHFRRHAKAAAENSKDSTKIGACLIDKQNQIVLTAYNGPAIGVKDTPIIRTLRPLKYSYVAHAEANLINFAARKGIATDGLTVYTTHASCANCADALIQAGIKCVIVGEADGVNKTAMPTDSFHGIASTKFSQADVDIINHDVDPVLEKADLLAKAMYSHCTISPREPDYYHVSRAVDAALGFGYELYSSTLVAMFAYLHFADFEHFIPKNSYYQAKSIHRNVEILTTQIEQYGGEKQVTYIDTLDQTPQTLVATLLLICDKYRDDRLLLIEDKEDRRSLATAVHEITYDVFRWLPAPFCYRQRLCTKLDEDVLRA